MILRSKKLKANQLVLLAQLLLLLSLNDVKNEILNVTNLVKISKLANLADYNVIIKDTEGKYFTTADYNKFTKMKNKIFVNQSAIFKFIKNIDLDVKIKISKLSRTMSRRRKNCENSNV